MGNKKYVELQFFAVSEEKSSQLLALLADIGYTGFEENEHSLTAYIEENCFSATELKSVLEMIPAGYKQSIIEEENWNAQWESSFQPIVVGDFVSVRASFHQPVENVKQEIIITPKMSFGTGHHATTYMMLEQMEHIDFSGKDVVDFGTGTAVLAILAEKLGARSVDAIDYDDWCIENSTENMAENGCSKINLIKAATIETGKRYDIILANINLHVIEENLINIKASAAKYASMLFSGFIKDDEPKMKALLAENGIQIINTIQKAEWLCISAKLD